jgi:hypothetical protein
MAYRTGTSRGSGCVPPPPGSTPHRTSTNPNPAVRSMISLEVNKFLTGKSSKWLDGISEAGWRFEAV